MAEIWNPNDRYILSNLTSQKLYAQSPLTTGMSGTSAYIGIEPSAQYNETVLYSGFSGLTAVTLSDSVSNYQYIRTELYNDGVDSNVIGTCLFPSDKKGAYCFEGGIISNQLHIYGGQIVTNGTSLSSTNGYHQWFTPSTGIGTEYTNSKICKVVGINRKENA